MSGPTAARERPDAERPRRRPLLPAQRIVVLFGGPSAEHDVSIVSGRAVAQALAQRGHAVDGWLIDLDGGWWPLPPHALDRAIPEAAYDDPPALGAEGRPRTAASALEQIGGGSPRPTVFPALHGPFGEDGTVQALLESAGLVYCGAGVAASAVGMDKALFKRVCESLGVPIARWIDVGAAAFASDAPATLARVAEFARSLPDPRLVIKPARLGSSIGVSIVHHPDDPEYAGAAITEAFRYDDLVLAEAYVANARELEASVVGNDSRDLAVYGPGEILPGREFYDFTAKYRSDLSRTITAPDLPAAVRAEVRRVAREVFLAIGAAGFARVDFLLGSDGRPVVSEINTIPGFTPISLFPLLVAEGGYDFGDICERIVQLAQQRAAGRADRHLTREDLP